MPKPSKRQLLLRAFAVLDYPPVRLRTRKYVGFVAPWGKVLLVGKSAALRTTGHDGKVSESRSLTDTRFYKTLLIVGERADYYNSVDQARADLDYEWSRKRKGL